MGDTDATHGASTTNKAVEEATVGTNNRDANVDAAANHDPEDDAGNHDNKEDSSVHSSSSSSDDDEEDDAAEDDEEGWQSLNIMERRARKVARNNQKLNELGLGHAPLRPSPLRRKRTVTQSTIYEQEDDTVPMGMLLDWPSCDTTIAEDGVVTRLEQDFPGRETQIRALWAHLYFCVRQNGTTVPSPLWITGPPGTAKSSAVQAVLAYLQQNETNAAIDDNNNKPLVSYVNNAGLLPQTVETLVTYIYKDLLQQLGLDMPMVRKRKRPATADDGKEKVPPTMNGDDNHDTEAVAARSLRPRKAAVVYTATTIGQGGVKKSKTSRLTAKDMAESTTPKVSKSYTAVWTLGRLWKSLAAGRPSILVLDQVWMVREFNLLAQFLLLPQQLTMNLSIIVITNNILLDQTRLNMMAGNSTSSLASCIQPARIHFPAYRGRAAFETILSLPRVRELMVGTGVDIQEKQGFQEKVYRSFTRTLVQSTYDLTKNVKEIIRFGRILWLRYTDPLHPGKIQEIVGTVTRKLASFQPPVEATPERLEQEVLAFLDQKMWSQVRPLTEEYLFALSVPLTGTVFQEHDMPDRAKYLLLAAYLCQVNRPDRDKHLFSIDKNGRKRKSVTETNTASEDTAFGTDSLPQPKTYRLRTFPLERMLSIFVSLVTLHQIEGHKDSLPEQETEQLLSLGDVSLLHNLEYLQDLGMLHEQPVTGPAEPIRLTGRRYWCELTENEALRLAESLQFPLTRYIL